MPTFDPNAPIAPALVFSDDAESNEEADSGRRPFPVRGSDRGPRGPLLIAYFDARRGDMDQLRYETIDYILRLEEAMKGA